MKTSPYFDRADSAWLRNGVLGGAALGALLLLALFYSVVAGAVERGASRRADLAEHASVATTVPSSRPIEVARLGN